jgi:hypothetical protein
VSVRFGNVLGSNGSVLRAFEAQAEHGLPITVTHPDITRYFMTITEASRLVIYAGAIGDPGEVLILDMGEPVRILDVAQRFADQHDPPLEIVVTGLRPAEKLHEDLISPDESGERWGAPGDHARVGGGAGARRDFCRPGSRSAHPGIRDCSHRLAGGDAPEGAGAVEWAITRRVTAGILRC